MIAHGDEIRLADLAQRSFHLITQLMLSLPRSRRRGPDNLKETEFLTLAVLHRQHGMTVGDIQRILGVPPAQMSRIIRSLEDRTPSLVVCAINARDKRRVDVALTTHGEQVLLDYAAPRVRAIADLLAQLSEEERENLSHVLERLATLSFPEPNFPSSVTRSTIG